MKPAFQIFTCFALFLFCAGGCESFNNDYTQRNSPTTGKLSVYYDEGLEPHVKNQVLTFESQYPNAQVNLISCSESAAVQALYNDSCEAIVISRRLSEKEKQAFRSRDFYPKYSEVAQSGIAVITNIGTAIKKITYKEALAMLSKPYSLIDSSGKTVELKILFDKNNSSVIHYLKDSILQGKNFSANSGILNSTLESINYVAQNKNTIAFIDYAWLSDADDSLYKANKKRIKFLCVGRVGNDSLFEYPDQSSFKLGTYPFTRSVYVYRKTGDFTLAKGFESFMASPAGQLIFLKQGLLPARQGERKIKVNANPSATE